MHRHLVEKKKKPLAALVGASNRHAKYGLGLGRGCGTRTASRVHHEGGHRKPKFSIRERESVIESMVTMILISILKPFQIHIRLHSISVESHHLL